MKECVSGPIQRCPQRSVAMSLLCRRETRDPRQLCPGPDPTATLPCSQMALSGNEEGGQLSGGGPKWPGAADRVVCHSPPRAHENGLGYLPHCGEQLRDPWESGEAVALTWFQATPPLFLPAMWKGQLRADCPRVFPETVTLVGSEHGVQGQHVPHPV